jgi:tetratricopeptide (TPR) repeat protein
MGTAAKLLARVCESTGSFNAGLLCNGLSGAAMAAIEKGGIGAGLLALGLTGPALMPAAIVLAALGGTAVFKAVCNSRKQGDLEARFKAIDTRSKTIEEAVLAMREAIEATGVKLDAEEVLDLRSIAAAAKDQDLTKLSDETAKRIIAALDEAGLATAEQLDAVHGTVKETWLRTLHIWEQQRANETWLRDWETRLNTKLDAIATDAKRGADAATEARDEVKGLRDDLKGHLRPTGLPLWTIPPLPTNRIDRDALVGKIRAALTSGGTASLSQAVAHAGGGFGKSVAAALYAHTYKDEYPGGAVWIDAAAEDAHEKPLAADQAFLAVARGLADLADKLKIPEDEWAAEATARHFAGADKQLEAACAVSAFLESSADDQGQPQLALLVLDNISHDSHWNHEPLKRLLPRRNVHIVATTRRERLGACRLVPVDKLTPREAVNLLTRYLAEDSSRTPARSVAANLGITDGELDGPTAAFDAAQARWGPVLHLAAHVEFIAVYVAAIGAIIRNTPGATWAAYWDEVKNSPIDAIPAEVAGIGATIEYPRHLHKILADAINSLPAPERAAMQHAAFLPVRGFPAFWLDELLTADASVKIPKVKGVPGSPARAVLEHLTSLDMLRGSLEAGGMLSPHRVYAAFVRQQLDAEPDRRRAVLDAIIALGERRGEASRDAVAGNLVIKDEPKRVRDRDALRAELTPLKDLAGVLDQAGEAAAGLLVANWLHTSLRGLGRFADGYDNLYRFLRPDRHWEGAGETTEHAIGHSNLALIQQDQGDLPGARESMERAIAIDEKHSAPDHPTFAIRYSNIATIQKDQGDLPGARRSMARAIAIDEKHFAPDHPTFATRYSNLAIIQQDQGDLPGARASMERAIAIQEKHFTPDHPTFATSYSNLAGIQQYLGDLPGARASVERAIAIDQKHFAPDHPTFATRYNNLATICYHEGDRDAACANFHKAVDILLKHFDENHPNVRSVRASMKTAGCGE